MMTESDLDHALLWDVAFESNYDLDGLVDVRNSHSRAMYSLPSRAIVLAQNAEMKSPGRAVDWYEPVAAGRVSLKKLDRAEFQRLIKLLPIRSWIHLLNSFQEDKDRPASGRAGRIMWYTLFTTMVSQPGADIPGSMPLESRLAHILYSFHIPLKAFVYFCFSQSYRFLAPPNAFRLYASRAPIQVT